MVVALDRVLLVLFMLLLLKSRSPLIFPGTSVFNPR